MREETSVRDRGEGNHDHSFSQIITDKSRSTRTLEKRRRTGSRHSWSCPTAFLRMIPSSEYLLGWMRSNSKPALWVGSVWTISDLEVLRHLRGFENWKKLLTVSRIRSQRQLGEEKKGRLLAQSPGRSGSDGKLRCVCPEGGAGKPHLVCNFHSSPAPAQQDQNLRI